MSWNRVEKKQIDKAVEMIQEGVPINVIAEETGIGKDTIKHIKRQYIASGAALDTVRVDTWQQLKRMGWPENGLDGWVIPPEKAVKKRSNFRTPYHPHGLYY